MRFAKVGGEMADYRKAAWIITVSAATFPTE